MAKSHFTRIVLLLLLVISVEANASFLDDDVDLFLGTGLSYSKETPCRLWNQRCHGFDTDEDNTDLFLRFGVELYDLVRFSAFSLNRYKADNIASNDEACVEANGPGAYKVCGNENRFVTRGKARGVSIGTDFEHKSFFVELATTYVWREFTIQVSNGVAPYTTLNQIYSGTKHGIGWMAGVGYKTKELSFGIWAYDDSLAHEFEHPEGKHITFVAGIESSF